MYILTDHTVCNVVSLCMCVIGYEILHKGKHWWGKTLVNLANYHKFVSLIRQLLFYKLSFYGKLLPAVQNDMIN